MDDMCPNCGSRGYGGWECIHCWWDPQQDHFMPYWMKDAKMPEPEWEQAVATGWKNATKR